MIVPQNNQNSSVVRVCVTIYLNIDHYNRQRKEMVVEEPLTWKTESRNQVQILIKTVYASIIALQRYETTFPHALLLHRYSNKMICQYVP